MNSPEKLNSKKAFSLIELLVVMLIIIVLAALIFPAIQSAKGRANQAKCMSNLHQLLNALMIFRADSGGQLIPFQLSAGGGYNPSGVIEGYLGVDNSLISPGTCWSSVWSCPSNPALPETPANPRPPWSESAVSYVLNSYLLDPDSPPGNPRGMNVAYVKYPTKLLLAFERDPRKQGGTALNISSFSFGDGGYYGHPNGNTVGFVDGHIESWQITHDGFKGSNGVGGNWKPHWYVNPD